MCVIIVVFSVRIFQNLDFGIEWVVRCKAMELESLRFIVRHLERVILVRPTYVLFSMETVSQGTFIYQFKPKTRKLERILIKLYRQNVTLLFNQTCFNERLLPNHTHTHTHIYIYKQDIQKMHLNVSFCFVNHLQVDDCMQCLKPHLKIIFK